MAKGKGLAFTLIVLMLTFGFTATAAGSDESTKKIPLLVNGNPASGEIKIVNNRAMVPFRSIFEALGAQVIWQAKHKKAEVFFNGNRLTLIPGAKNAQVNGVFKDLHVPAMLEAGRLLVPLRFFCESLGLTVNYDGNKGISINHNSQKEPIENIPLIADASWSISFGNDIELTMTIKNTGSEGYKRIFSTGQDYEILICNNSGELVWKYSKDKFFTQAIRSVFFAPNVQKSFVITIPYQKPGDYFVEIYYYGISKTQPAKTLNLTVDWEPSA